MAAANSGWNLGFLTILHEPSGYLGGYLVTNQWGRPLEFRLSSAVQPNRVHKILYAGTLQPYLCADLIGKTLVEKTPTPAHLVVTDTPACLDLRLRLDLPVLWLSPAGDGGWPALRLVSQPRSRGFARFGFSRCATTGSSPTAGNPVNGVGSPAAYRPPAVNGGSKSPQAP